MLQVETISAVDLPEGRRGEFVLDHAHLHLLDRIQRWCDEDISEDHPEVTRTEQPDGMWLFMAEGVVQLILRALGLPPHTSMIQMGDENAALSAGVLPAEPLVMIAVTTAVDGAPTVMVQAVPEEPRSNSQLSRGERRPRMAQDEQVSPEEEPVKKMRKRKKETSKKKKAAKTAKKVRKLSSSEDSEAMPPPVASRSHKAMGEVAPEQTAAEQDPSRPQSPFLFHDEGLEDAPAEMPDLETEQEAAAAREKSQPTPEAQWEEVPMQQEEEAVRQENERLEQLHEIRRLATLTQATAQQEDQVFMVASDEDLSMDWRPYEEVLAEDMDSIHKVMSLVKKTQEEVCFSFPDYVSSWVPEEGYVAVVTQQWGTGKSCVNNLPPPASTVVFWYVQLLETVGAVFCMVKQTYAVDPNTKKKDMVCITFAAVHNLTFVHEVEQKQQLVLVHLLVLATDKERQRNNRLDIDFTQIVPIDTTPIEEGLCFYNPRVSGDDVLYEHCLGTWEDWFRVGPECLSEDFPMLMGTINTYNGLYPLWLNQAKDMRVTRRLPNVTTDTLHKKYIKLAQGFLKDAQEQGLTVLLRVTVTVGETSAYKACQAVQREARRKRAVSRRQEKGEATKTVSFQVDEMAEEKGQQLGARVPHQSLRKHRGTAQTPTAASPPSSLATPVTPTTLAVPAQTSSMSRRKGRPKRCGPKLYQSTKDKQTQAWAVARKALGAPRRGSGCGASADPNAIRRRVHRWRPGTRALSEIRHYQKLTALLI